MTAAARPPVGDVTGPAGRVRPVLRWFGLQDVPADLSGSVVTIGNFDGVHLGHRRVLGTVVDRAATAGLTAVAVTFDPHPVRVLRPDLAPAALCDLEERLALIEGTGVDAVLVLPFTLDLASWSPEAFVDRVLLDALRARLVVAGRDMRFGHRNAGTLQTLADLGVTRGFDVEVVPDTGTPEADAGQEARWSSSLVRRLVADGDVVAAARVLGRPHRLHGPVVHGDHRGRALGYPTANLGLDDLDQAPAVPADGVYAGWLVRPSLPGDHPDARLPAAISIGTNPTFDGTQRRVESYVLDRTDLDLYGEDVTVEFARRLRPTVRFDGVEALLEQMAEDVRQCRSILGVAQGS